jgi:hypothetical protein
MSAFGVVVIALAGGTLRTAIIVDEQGSRRTKMSKPELN